MVFPNCAALAAGLTPSRDGLAGLTGAVRGGTGAMRFPVESARYPWDWWRRGMDGTALCSGCTCSRADVLPFTAGRCGPNDDGNTCSPGPGISTWCFSTSSDRVAVDANPDDSRGSAAAAAATAAKPPAAGPSDARKLPGPGVMADVVLLGMTSLAAWELKGGYDGDGGAVPPTLYASGPTAAGVPVPDRNVEDRLVGQGTKREGQKERGTQGGGNKHNEEVCVMQAAGVFARCFRDKECVHVYRKPAKQQCCNTTTARYTHSHGRRCHRHGDSSNKVVTKDVPQH